DRMGFADGATPRTGGPVSGIVVLMHQQGSVEGAIVDASGARVPLAHYWARELAWPNRSFGSPSDPLIAGSDGAFFINNVFAGGVRVSAASPIHQEERGDWQGEIRFEEDDQTNVTLELASGGTGSVSVTVVDPDNGFARVPFAEVTLLRGGQGFDFSTTDQNGITVFEAVPAGSFDYSVIATSKRVGRSGTSAVFRLARDAIAPVQVTLDLLGRVSGTLVDGDIAPPPPVKGAPVFLNAAAMNTTASTGGAGEFFFEGVPEGTFHLDAIDLDSGRHAIPLGDLFISKLFPERSGIQLALEKTATLHVKVYLPDDAGNAGVLAPMADVVVTQNGTPYRRELQGNDLTFARLFPRASYHVEGKELGGEERTVRYDGGFAAGTYDGSVALVLPASGRVEVHVAAGDPALEVNARVTISAPNRIATIYTDADGSAAGGGFALGAIGVQVSSSNLSASASGALESATTPLVLNVQLGNRVSIEGFADAEEGGPSAGTRVKLDASGTALSAPLHLESRTDDDGHYRFDGIPVAGTVLTLTMFGPDDVTIGAVLADETLPDGSSGTLSMPRVRLDATPPRVVNIDPPNNANSVSPNANMVVTFSEPVAPPYVSRAFFQLVATDDQTVAPTAVTSEVGGGEFRVRIAPTALLKSNVVYRIAISGNVQDLAGHTIPAPVGSSFTTVNYTEPRVISVDPPVELPIADGATFRLRFNKAIDIVSFQPGNGGVAKVEQLDAAHGNPVLVIPVELSIDPLSAATLVVAPSGVAVQPSSFYRVTVSGTRDTQSPPNVQASPQDFDYFSYDHVRPVVSIGSPVPAGYPLVSG
ncbi:MAG TPA: Ig-like domain-containing protein, partial [Thermoanaerobaculia bacterium]|nr:Ig-like domain-containing protein [Thermoanaerobaculia bacterium]